MKNNEHAKSATFPMTMAGTEMGLLPITSTIYFSCVHIMMPASTTHNVLPHQAVKPASRHQMTAALREYCSWSIQQPNEHRYAV